MNGKCAQRAMASSIFGMIALVALVLSLTATPAKAQQETGAAKAPATQQEAPPPATVNGSGTTNFIPVWTNSSTIGNSVLFQKSGNVGAGTLTPGAKLDAKGTGIAVRGITSGATGIGLFGSATSTSGSTVGVEGMVSSSVAFPGLTSGVLGVSTATTGNTSGVLGDDSNPSGAGLFGQTFAATGGRGVEGLVGNDSGIGVRGDATSATGTALGVLGVSFSATGIAVVGNAASSTGSPIALYGQVTSASGTAELLDNLGGGDLVVGQVSGVHKFRVDGTGKGFFDGGTVTGGADFAESVAVRGDRAGYEAGDLLAIDAHGERQLQLTQEPYSSAVAGIYSTKPGVLATSHAMDDSRLATEIPLAVVGIVPCKVSNENGPIKAGDLLVSSATPGYAMKGTDRSRMLGAVVGKALEPLQGSKGAIQVLVTLQ